MRSNKIPDPGKDIACNNEQKIVQSTFFRVNPSQVRNLINRKNKTEQLLVKKYTVKLRNKEIYHFEHLLRQKTPTGLNFGMEKCPNI